MGNHYTVYEDNHNRRKGYSLVEVLVGTAVMSLLLLALPATYVGMRKLNTETDTQIRSSLLVSAELERMRTLEYSEIEALEGSTIIKTSSHPTLDNITFSVATVVEYGTDELEDMLDVTVTVNWLENSRLRNVAGRAFFARDGLSDKKFENAN